MTTNKEVLEKCRRLNITDEDLCLIETLRGSIKTKEDRKAFENMDWDALAAGVKTVTALRISGHFAAWVLGSGLGTIIIINQYKDELTELFTWISGR